MVTPQQGLAMAKFTGTAPLWEQNSPKQMLVIKLSAKTLLAGVQVT